MFPFTYTVAPAVEFSQFIEEEPSPPAPKPKGMGSAASESVWWEPANADDAWNAVVALCRDAR